MGKFAKLRNFRGKSPVFKTLLSMKHVELTTLSQNKENRWKRIKS